MYLKVVLIATLVYAVVAAQSHEDVEDDHGSHSENSHGIKVPVTKTTGDRILHPLPVALLRYAKVPIPYSYPFNATFEQPIQKPVYKMVPIIIEKPLPYDVEKAVPYEVEKQYPVEVEKTIEIAVPKPYPVRVPVY